MDSYDPLDDVEEAFNNFPCSSVERKAFSEHLYKVLLALHAISDVDRGYNTKGREEKYICDCLYDFASQDLIESGCD